MPRHHPAVSHCLCAFTLYFSSPVTIAQQPVPTSNPYTQLMERAAAQAAVHGARPALSPLDRTVLSGQVPVAELQRRGFVVVPWTTNDPETMRVVIRTGVDGLISDRPDLLQRVLAEERASSPEAATRLRGFDVQGHRGARGLRPENTLPAFEAGLDNGIGTIETDTGVTRDGVSLIWHDQFLNPMSCRRADGKPYTLANRAFVQDLTLAEAQHTFVCDKLRFGADQRNDLALSPVASAFAQAEHLASPYVPTYAGQLFRFVQFYAAYYRTGPGKAFPEAAQRGATAERVHFNLETKILPPWQPPAGMNVPAEMTENHTASPQQFVAALCEAIERGGMTDRADVQSFDFRTLLLVAEQHPKLLTFYLTQDERLFLTDFIPSALRATSRP